MLRKAHRTVRDWENLLDSLPVEVSAILDGIRTGQIEVPLDLRGLDRNVNRVVCAVLAAALFTGSARLWGAEVAPRTRGVSLPGALGTLTAGAFAIRLLRALRHTGGIG